MSQKITDLAKKITKSSSIQTYYTIILLTDKNLVNDCFKAYAYFRWLDDEIDIELNSKSKRLLFIKRQKRIINDLYKQKKVSELSLEERIIDELIKSDTSKNSKLKSFIINFLKIIEFDADRKARIINQKELDWYSDTLGKAVTDCLQYFIGNQKHYQTSKDQYKAATAAHITHMLRDLNKDVTNGYINLPKEYLTKSKLKPDDNDNPIYQRLIKERVLQARDYFKSGKQYLDKLSVLRCKLAGYWYCFRFEQTLEKIEQDKFRLRKNYSRGRDLLTIARFIWLTILVSWRHYYKIIIK